MVHILIGFADALPAPEVLFSLRRAGHTVSLFSRAPIGVLTRLSPKAVHVLPDPAKDAEGAVAGLARLMAAADAPDLVMPLDDGGLWLTNAALGLDRRIVGATGKQVEIALDKARQITAARAAGLTVPETRLVCSAADLDAPLHLPAIAKPSDAIRLEGAGLTKGEARYLLSKSDVDSLRGAFTKASGPLLIQPLIAGQGQGVFGFATPDGVVAWSGHRRLRMMNPHGSGSSACATWPPDEELRASVARFLDAIGWRGPFMVELLRDHEGTAWFMELNGRMWGSLALARRQGYEYPAWAVALAADTEFQPPVSPSPGPEALIMRHLGRDLLHLLFVLKGPRTALHRRHWPSFWTSLVAVLRPAPARRFYNYDPAAPGFFLWDALSTIWTFIRRRR
ncbi:hypothetical protein JQU17_20055 [Ponticoccus sp. SC2-23]|uniref:hypothetical protein n=1 Tax=Alexandriicola marinus TaxID=2081710 RepID=UPI000FD84DF9|nr:hypothetical protein [Alexandriicola marinus]MBM1222509.1 hypothetical protein [Ponticoccus sp. SC6-9]MBM1227015.1 hypothetical protein [Ponticoccus sp. SC6-15]MBM1231436.1 hypothetical protein [Ponticoccus sp. SC6-38]MBM1236009.1 hypothetical protein [Ponticoccus sp. SC6-45]MBM1240459.1 hypothetical protein [Ponticoccus sp. SC6-49]MBM1244994.1 hypothetical protein [Ponticoccus sp. SC2-64]MBM1249483.1 hypothetical protein [Ponticoccus sp. SC6-42]MBM1253952.1 hypothetical protein [Pontico